MYSLVLVLSPPWVGWAPSSLALGAAGGALNGAGAGAATAGAGAASRIGRAAHVEAEHESGSKDSANVGAA